MKIDPKFYRGENHPVAYTVGELEKIIAELPDDLEVQTLYGAGVRVVVYNHGHDDEHLEFDEVDGEG